MIKKKFIIEPHFRLQEWVAEEKGYFKDEGLDYVFQELIQSTDGAHHYKGDKVGAMQSFERGRTSDVSCACHWTVGVAAITASSYLPEPKPLSAKIPWSAIHLKVSSKTSLV